MAGPGKRVPAPGGGPPENSVALLGAAYDRLGHLIVDAVVAAGFPQRAAHSSVFANLDPAGSRVTDLAARAGMTAQAMGELVTDLERLGYVQRAPDPTDGRAKLVVLTDRGRASVDAAFEAIGAIADELAALLGPRRATQLQHDLERIVGHDWTAVRAGRRTARRDVSNARRT